MKHLKEMMEAGVIRKSNSPWASAVVLVQKKDGSFRFCTDLRRLNTRTVRDVYSLPQIDETILFKWYECIHNIGSEIRILASCI